MVSAMVADHGTKLRFQGPGVKSRLDDTAPGHLKEQIMLQPESLLDVCQRIADRYQPSSTAEYLEAFRASFEKHLEALEGPMTADLESRGPSEDLMHEWSLFVAQGQDFLKALAAEIEKGA